MWRKLSRSTRSRSENGGGNLLKLRIEYAVGDTQNNSFANRALEYTVEADPLTPYSVLKKDIADTMHVPAVNLSLRDRHGKKQPIALSDHDTIGAVLKTGDHLIATLEGPSRSAISAASQHPRNQTIEYHVDFNGNMGGGDTDRHRPIESKRPEFEMDGVTEDLALQIATEESMQVNARNDWWEPNAITDTQTHRQHDYQSWNGESSFAPGNDMEGEIIVQGNISQYSVDHGSLACASICLMAVKEFLVRDFLYGVDLDAIVMKGAHAHRKLGMQHAMIDEIWGHSTFSEAVTGLRRGTMHQGILKRNEGFEMALQHALSCEEDRDCEKGKVGVLLTKLGETVLCLHHDASWYLFDSHGESHASIKRAYLKRYDGMSALASALLTKHPVQDFGPGLQSEMYNMFEAIPVLLLSRGSRQTLLMPTGANGASAGEATFNPSNLTLPSTMDLPTNAIARPPRGINIAHTSSSVLSTSVCTCICIVAARYCLAQPSVDNVDFGPIVRLGVMNRDKIGVSAQDIIEETWSKPALADTVTSLQKGSVLRGVADTADGLLAGLRHGVHFMMEFDLRKVGVLLIKSGRPYLCLLHSGSWHLFRTNGRGDVGTEMKKCGSMASLANLLLSDEKDGVALEGNLVPQVSHDSPSFEAHPIVWTPGDTVDRKFDDAIRELRWS